MPYKLRLGALAVSVGFTRQCGIDKFNTLICWGLNNKGENKKMYEGEKINFPLGHDEEDKEEEQEGVKEVVELLSDDKEGGDEEGKVLKLSLNDYEGDSLNDKENENSWDLILNEMINEKDNKNEINLKEPIVSQDDEYKVQTEPISFQNDVDTKHDTVDA